MASNNNKKHIAINQLTRNASQSYNTNPNRSNVLQLTLGSRLEEVWVCCHMSSRARNGEKEFGKCRAALIWSSRVPMMHPPRMEFAPTRMHEQHPQQHEHWAWNDRPVKKMTENSQPTFVHNFHEQLFLQHLLRCAREISFGRYASRRIGHLLFRVCVCVCETFT